LTGGSATGVLLTVVPLGGTVTNFNIHGGMVVPNRSAVLAFGLMHYVTGRSSTPWRLRWSKLTARSAGCPPQCAIVHKAGH